MLLLIHSLDYGGAERVIVDMARNLDSAGYKVAICAFSDKLGLGKEFEETSVDLYILEKRSRFDLMLVVRLTRLMRRLRPDVVSMHCRDALHFGTPACLLARVPRRIATEHSVGSGTSQFLNSLAYRMSLPTWTAAVAVSEFLKELMLRKWHLPAEKVRVIYNGIDLSRLQPGTDSTYIRRELGLPSEARIVGNVATLKKEKGLDDFLEIAAAIAPRNKWVHFVLIGGGPLVSHLVSRAAQLGLSARLHLMGTRADIADLVAGFDVFLCTSEVETFGLAVVEAMYLRVPVVAFDVGAMKEVIFDGVDGFLVKPRDIDNAAARVMSLIENPRLSEMIGAAARESVETRFSIHTMVREYERLFF